jgi:glycogen(starch) synthase
MESLKIAFFCWESLHGERVGGLANAATHLAEALARDHEVHFFTRGGEDREINGVNYHFCRPCGENIVDFCADMSRSMTEQFREQEHGGNQFDILHFHDWHPVEAMHRLQDRATVFTYHSTEYGRNGNNSGDWWEFREISGKEWYGGYIAKRVTAVSQPLKTEVMQLYNVPEWKCDAVPNGVVPQTYRSLVDPGEVKQSCGMDPRAPLILFIGRLAYQKGPDLLVDAVGLAGLERSNARVIIAGDGVMRQALESNAFHLPVQFRGYVSDSEYIRLLNASDLVVIPSRNEPFGLVLLEAWSAEKCVVATDVGGLSVNISHEVDGLKVPVSPEGLATGITRMVDDPESRIRFGLRGRRKVDNEFRWEPIAGTLENTYRKVTA